MRALERLSELTPDLRFGQLIANLSYLAVGPTNKATWDMEGKRLLKAIRQHIADLSRRTSGVARTPPHGGASGMNDGSPASGSAPPARRFQIGPRRLLILVAAACVLFAYLGSYYRLSRRGLAEAPEFGLDGFLYVSMARAENLDGHYGLMFFYAPANWADRAFCGGPSPVTCIIWRISE